MTRTRLELPVVLAWRDLGYGRFGCCATCGRDRDGDRPMFVRGVNTDSLVCLSCFEFEHGQCAPNYRRRRPPAGKERPMPRRNRPPEHVKPQHGKPGEQSKRPRGWHRRSSSPEVKAADDALRKLNEADRRAA